MKRNCRTFMIGVVLYLILWMIIKNLKVQSKNPIYDAIESGLLVLLIADISVVSYTYKTYYGRSIITEINNPGCNSKELKWNDMTHKYEPLPLEEQLQQQIEEKKIKNKHDIERKILDDQNSVLKKYLEENKKELIKKQQTQKKYDDIINNKLRTRAAITIQRWWRKKLYEPPNGIIYLRTKYHFDTMANNK